MTAHPVTTGQVTLATFRAACAKYGIPASTLTDNGNVCTTRLTGGKGGRHGLENEHGLDSSTARWRDPWQQRHLAEQCEDEQCPRLPCRMFKAGYRKGCDRGYSQGFIDGEAAGYSAGFAAGMAAAAGSGEPA